MVTACAEGADPKVYCPLPRMSDEPLGMPLYVTYADMLYMPASLLAGCRSPLYCIFTLSPGWKMLLPGRVTFDISRWHGFAVMTW